VLFRLLIFVILGMVIYRVARSWLGGSGQQDARPDNRPPEQVDDEMIKDPVCGTYFARHSGVALTASNKVLHFCSDECRDSYVAHPSKYQ